MRRDPSTGRRTRMVRPGPATVTLAVLALLLGGLVGCGRSAAGPAPEGQRQVSDDTVNQRLFECLTEAGFPVTRGPNGEVTFVDPDDAQFSAYQAALEQCRRQLVAEGLLPAVDAEQLRQEYRRLAALHECLAANGFPTVDFPSEDTYVERREEFPNLFALNTEQEWDRARRACPEEMAAFDGGTGR